MRSYLLEKFGNRTDCYVWSVPLCKQNRKCCSKIFLCHLEIMALKDIPMQEGLLIVKEIHMEGLHVISSAVTTVIHPQNCSHAGKWLKGRSELTWAFQERFRSISEAERLACRHAVFVDLSIFPDRLLCTDKVNNNCNIPVINDMNQRCVAVF